MPEIVHPLTDWIFFEIPDLPISQVRYRFARKHAADSAEEPEYVHAPAKRKINVYSDQNEERNHYRKMARALIPLGRPLATAISLVVVYYLPLPRKHLKRAQSEAVFVVTKPDESNLRKWMEDCLNGIAWADDCLIVESYGRKSFCEDGAERTSIGFRSLTAENFDGWLLTPTKEGLVLKNPPAQGFAASGQVSSIASGCR